MTELERDREALVIEPHEGCRSLFCDLLVEAGYEPTATGEPREAISFLEQRRFRVVIASVLSTQGQGLRLIELLREAEPRPVVLLPCAEIGPVKEMVHEALGFGELILKTASIAQFLDMIPRPWTPTVA